MKVYSILKSIIWKIKYLNRLKIKITRHINKNSNISINNGKIYIGKGLGLNNNSKIAANNGKIFIGNYVNFNTNCICVSHKSIRIGDKCSFGPNVCIYDHDHAFNENGKIPGKFTEAEVVIEENVWVGANSVILKGTKIGKNSVIGAGCVLKGDIPPNSLVIANRDVTIKKLEKR